MFSCEGRKKIKKEADETLEVFDFFSISDLLRLLSPLGMNTLLKNLIELNISRRSLVCTRLIKAFIKDIQIVVYRSGQGGFVVYNGEGFVVFSVMILFL